MAKSAAGAPPHKPTQKSRDNVSLLLGCGMTQGNVASVLGISVNTLKKYYAEELLLGKSKMQQMAFGKMYQGIKAGDKTLLIFYLKTQCGWRETYEVGASETLKPIKVSVIPADRKIPSRPKKDKK